MVLTTPEALEQRTAIAGRTVEELRGYGLTVNDTLRTVVDRTAAAFNGQREVTDTAFADRVRTDIVRAYGGRNAEPAIAIIRARDFIMRDLERAQTRYDAFLDERTSPGMLANNLEVLKDELVRYRGFNRFSPEMDTHAREAELAINRLMRNLTEYPTEHTERMRAMDEIFRDFNSLEAAMNRFAQTTNAQVATLLRTSQSAPTQMVAQPTPVAPVVRPREPPRLEEPTRAPVPVLQPVAPPVEAVVQRPARREETVVAPTRPVMRETTPQTDQSLMALDTPQGQRRLGTLLQTQNPTETAFTSAQLGDIGRVFGEMKRYSHFREEWNEAAQEGLLRAYHQGGRAAFLNELGTIAQMSYNPERDTTPLDYRLDAIRTSLRGPSTTTANIAQPQVQTQPQEQHVENPLVTLFNDRIRDGDQTADTVRATAQRIHQARLDAEAAVSRGDVAALERAQRIAREENARIGDPIGSLNNYLSYARGAKERVPREERAPLEQTYARLERRRSEIEGYQRAAAADMRFIEGARVQRTEAVVQAYVPRGTARGTAQAPLGPEAQAQLAQITRLVSNGNIGDVQDTTNRATFLFQLQASGLLRKLDGGSLSEVNLSGLLSTVQNVAAPANPASAARKAADINRALLRYEAEAMVFIYGNYFTPEGGSYLNDTEGAALETRLQALRTTADRMIRGSVYNPQTSVELRSVLDVFRQVHEIAAQDLSYEEKQTRIREVMSRAGLITSA